MNLKLSAFLLLLSFQVFAQQYKEEKDIQYYENPTSEYMKQQSKLDIHFPDSDNNKKYPVIVWFHGGGLTGGGKEIPKELKNKEVVVVGVGYRLAPKIKAEKTIDDATAAIAWVFKNIEKYHGNTEEIFVSGHSAGGYLALMAIMNKENLAQYDIEANDVAGLIPFSGHTITHFTIRDQKGIPGTQAIVDKWAPLFYVRSDAPPTLLITGDREMEMLGRYEENAYFYRMMKVAGQKEIDLYEMNGYGHNMVYPALPLLLKFVKEKSDQ